MQGNDAKVNKLLWKSRQCLRSFRRALIKISALAKPNQCPCLRWSAAKRSSLAALYHPRAYSKDLTAQDSLTYLQLKDFKIDPFLIPPRDCAACSGRVVGLSLTQTHANAAGRATELLQPRPQVDQGKKRDSLSNSCSRDALFSCRRRAIECTGLV